jgi:hypothetical protein
MKYRVNISEYFYPNINVVCQEAQAGMKYEKKRTCLLQVD